MSESSCTARVLREAVIVDVNRTGHKRLTQHVVVNPRTEKRQTTTATTTTNGDENDEDGTVIFLRGVLQVYQSPIVGTLLERTWWAEGRAEVEQEVKREREEDRERRKRGHVSNISLDSGPRYRGTYREGRCLERVAVYYSPRFLCPPFYSLSHPLPVLFPPSCRFSPVKLSAEFNPMQLFSSLPSLVRT